MNNQVTMRDVAAHAGVSVMTVSNVINDRPYISPEMKKRVLSSIDALGYKPNRMAQDLRTRRPRVLGVIIPDIRNPFFTAIVSGIEDVTNEAGFMIFLGNTGNKLHRENQLVDALSAGIVGGVVLCTADENKACQQIETFQDANIPVVAVTRVPATANVDSVITDNFQASYSAIQHFLELGHRRVGFITGPEIFSAFRDRIDGYKQALLDWGLAPTDDLIRHPDSGITSPIEATKATTHQLLDLSSPPTALLVGNNQMALGSIQVIHDRKIKMPDDLALIIFDGLEWSQAFDPPITVVSQPAYKIGQTIAQILLKRIKDYNAPVSQIRLPATIVHGQSCCKSGTPILPQHRSKERCRSSPKSG